MASRRIAIINYMNDRDVTENILKKVPTSIEPIVFLQHGSSKSYPNAKTRFFPEDLDSKAAAKNFIAKTAKSEGWTGWLYVIEDDMQLIADAEETSFFLDKLENMLEKLGFDTWMNTATDLFNHVWSKYSYRFRAMIDDPEYSSLIEQVIFCSHANPNVMLFNLDKVRLEKMLFDEDYEIPMYYIISYLASRRNDKNDPGIMFMNFYPTVPGEEKIWKRDPAIANGKSAVSLEE